MMIFAFSELCSISVLANRISLVKYNVLIKKVPKPIATTKTTVWLLGLNKFNKLCLSVKPQRFGKYRLIALIQRSEEHTSELQSRPHLVCRLLLEKKKQK